MNRADENGSLGGQPTSYEEKLANRRRARWIGTIVAVLVIIGVAVAGGSGGGDGRQARPAGESTNARDGCGASPAPAPITPRFRRPPQPRLEENVDYAAVVRTSCGDIEIDLLEDRAPIAVNNFVFLAGRGFYNGLVWHRIERDFVIQTGDPNASSLTEPNGPGYSIPDELPDKGREYVFGAVAMANAGAPGSSGSEFFIVVHRRGPAGLQPRYTIFGRVEQSSYDTLRKIARQRVHGGTDPEKSVSPVVPIYIDSVEIVKR